MKRRRIVRSHVRFCEPDTCSSTNQARASPSQAGTRNSLSSCECPDLDPYQTAPKPHTSATPRMVDTRKVGRSRGSDGLMEVTIGAGNRRDVHQAVPGRQLPDGFLQCQSDRRPHIGHRRPRQTERVERRCHAGTDAGCRIGEGAVEVEDDQIEWVHGYTGIGRPAGPSWHLGHRRMSASIPYAPYSCPHTVHRKT